MRQLFAAIGALLLCGCMDMTGHWTGTIEDSLRGRGSLDARLVQQGDEVTGVWTAAFGSPEFELAGVVSGQVERNSFAAVLTPSDNHYCPMSAVGIWSASSLTATYAAFNCAETDTGSFALVRDTSALAGPTAQFMASPLTGAAPLSVAFIDESDPGDSLITSWQWGFGDGGTGSLQDPTHVFVSPGSYTVTLRVSSPFGQDEERKTGYITVREPRAPTARLRTVPPIGAAPLMVAFIDDSDPGDSFITSWEWGFGDGATSSLQNPTHLFVLPGSYTVALRVSSPFGQDEERKIGCVTVLEPTGEGEGEGEGEVYFVDKRNVQGPWDGSSWGHAYRDLQIGVDAAATAGGGQVWVAEGVYDEVRNDPSGALVMRESVHIYGGFAGDEETLAQRDAPLHPTLIDGAVARNGSRAYHVLLGADDSTIDGFTICGGKADGGGDEDYGAGVWNDNASLFVINCLFHDNHARNGGGGAYLRNSAARFMRCAFSGNTSFGGGAHSDGGAMYVSASTPIMHKCMFANCAAPDDGGAIANVHESSPIISSCTFVLNTAGQGRGGAIATYDHCVANVENCLFVDNHAARGGALYNKITSFPVTNCTFYGNTTSAICNEGSSPTVVNCIFWDLGADREIDGSACVIAYSDVRVGYVGQGNITEDPLFVDGASGDLRLEADSPCVDSGASEEAPVFDIAGNPRPMGYGFDMGAYEFVFPR